MFFEEIIGAFTGQNKRTRRRQVTIGVILGTLSGAALGILFAPQAGEETREQLCEAATKGAKAVKDYSVKAGAVIKEKAEETGDAVAKKARQMAREARRLAKSIVDEGIEVAEDIEEELEDVAEKLDEKEEKEKKK